MPGKKKTRKWFRNFMDSLNDIWKDVSNDIPGLCLANGVFMHIKEAKAKGYKITDPKNIKKLDFNLAKSFKDFFYTYMYDKEEIENVRKLMKDAKYRITSGDILNKYNKSKEELQRIKDEEELDRLLSQLDDDYTIDPTKGGEMIKENYQMNKIRLRQLSFSESLEVLSNMTKTNEVVQNLCNHILDKAQFCENLSPNDVNDIIVDNTVKELKGQLISVMVPLSKSQVVAKSYADTMGTAAAVINEIKADYQAKAPNDENIDELLEEIRNENKTIEELSPDTAQVFRDKIQNTVDDLRDIKDDLKFDPIVDEEGEKTLVAASELKSSKENFGALASTTGMVNGGVLLSAGMATIGALVALPSIISHIVASRDAKNIQSKFGGNTGIVQPLLATNRINKETIKQVSKALEVKLALKLKLALESTLEAMDGGIVNARMRQINMASPAKIEPKNVKLYSGNVASYDEILSYFSESGIKGKYLGHMLTDELYIIPSAIEYFSKNLAEAKAIAAREYVTSSESSKIEMLKDRSALPTHINVKIKYTREKNIKGDTEVKENDTTISYKINPRVVKSSELVDIIKTNSFAKVGADKEEKTLFGRIKDVVMFWSKRKNENKPETKVLKSPGIANVMEKIKNIKTPLFHIMLEYQDYLDLKNAGVDIMNRETYAKLMSSLPIISIAIINEDSGTVLISETATMNYIKADVSDFVDNSLQMEKQLRSELRFRNNL